MNKRYGLSIYHGHRDVYRLWPADPEMAHRTVRQPAGPIWGETLFFA